MEGGSSGLISEFCSRIVDTSWLQYPKLTARNKDELYPILQYNHMGGVNDPLPPRNVKHGYGYNPLSSTDMAISEYSSTEGFCNPSYKLKDCQSVKSSAEKALSASKVDSLGMTIVSTLCDAFPTTACNTSESSEDKLHIAKVAQRLAGARPVSDLGDDETLSALAKTLFNMAANDECLWKHIQTSEFDGTWVAIICGFYQRLYLHHTQIIREHCFSNLQCNNLLLSEGKLMVLLFRLQHLQIFQRVVNQQILVQSSAHDDEDGKKMHIMKMLGSKTFLISSLLESLVQIMDKVRRWAKRQLQFGVIGVDGVPPIKYSNKGLCLVDIDTRLFDKQTLQSRRPLKRNRGSSSYSNKLDDIPLLHKFLACVLLHILDYGEGLQDDKWLWNYLHNLKTPLERKSKSTITCSLYQGLYLYHTDSVINHFLSTSNTDHSILAKERITVLLFRSQHLQNFQSVVEENLQNREVYNSHTSPKFLLMSLLLESLQETSDSIQRWASNVTMELNRCRVPSEVSNVGAILNDERNAHSEVEFIHGKEVNSKEDLMQYDSTVEIGGIDTKRPTSFQLMVQGLPLHTSACDDRQNQVQNVFLGSNCIPNGWKVEDLIDLKFVYALGGLICTVEGDPSKSQADKCSSWCIVRHDITGLLFCVDLKDDVYQNKHQVLNGTSNIDYEGILEVATIDGKTTVKSIQGDGSYYFGDLEDFASRRMNEARESCASKALHVLPGSDFLREFSLKCSALHLLALAFSVGNKEYLIFNWAGDSGHIEYLIPEKDSSRKKEDTINCALQKCNVLYTNEGTIISEDIIWKGDGNGGRWGPQEMEAAVDSTIIARPRRPAGGGEDNDKITIIFQHGELWNDHECSTQHLHLDVDQIQASLRKSHAESQEDMIPEVAAVLAALKRNGGGGFGAFGWKVEGHLEWRPPQVESLVRKFVHETIVKEYLRTTVVVHPELHHDKFNTLQVQLKNGTIAEHPEEFFVVTTSGSCLMQVYLYISEPETFVWLTDIVVANATTVRRIFKESLRGKSMTILRSNSLMEMNPEHVLLESFPLLCRLPHFKEKLSKKQIVTRETMVHKDALEGFPSSKDQWNLIVGQQKEYNNKEYYLKATEMQAITCAATRYTTGGALLRTKKEIQPATSSNSSSTSNPIQVHHHGSCTRICALQFHIEEHKVEATGKFSTFKGIKKPSVVYWG